MRKWNDDDLRRIGTADGIRVSSRRTDGSLRPPVTTWHAVVGSVLYLRSARGPENGWFRRAVLSGVGRISAGGVTQDVTFELADPAVRDDLDVALHWKYDRYGAAPVGAITGDDVLQTTLKLLPVA